MSHPTLRPACRLVPLLVLLLLPGCLTAMLWEIDDDDFPDDESGGSYYEDTLADDVVEELAGALVLDGDALLFCRPDGAALWSLQPGEGAGAVLALLADVEFGRVVDADVYTEVERAGSHVLTEQTSVRIRFELRPEAAVREVDEVSPNARLALAAAQPAGAGLSQLHADAAVRVTTPVMRNLLGEREIAVDGALYVDRDGEPVDRPANSLALDTGLGGVEAQVRALAQYELLVRLRGPDGARFVCVHPARAWLWTGIAGRRHTLELHSTWFVEPGPLDAVAGTEAAVARTARGFVPATATWRTLTYRRRLVERSEVRVEESGMSIWGKLALTPLTLALDCLLAPVYAWFEDDDCDE